MSLNVSQAKLQRAVKTLMIQWEQTTDSWNDPVSQRFEKHFLEPIEPSVRSALAAMNQMEDVLHRARSECQQTR